MRGVLLLSCIVGGFSGTHSPSAFAQAPAAEWASVAKIINGNCRDGAIAQVVERAGVLSIKFFINGQQSNEIRVPLAADGSGKGDFKGVYGRHVIEVSAGIGKRPMKQSQLDGSCQWSYMPK